VQVTRLNVANTSDAELETSLGAFVPRPPRATFKPEKPRRTGLIVVLVLALAAGATAGAVLLRARPVVVTPVIRGSAINAVYATGTAEAYDRVVVKSKLAGTVEELRVREGAPVKKGEVLARLASRSIQAELARGRAEVYAAHQHAAPAGPRLRALQAHMRALQARRTLADSERDRLKRLVASGTLPAVELERASAQAEEVTAQLAAASAEYGAMKIDVEARASESNAELDSLVERVSDLEVRAPIDGVVLARMVEPGQVVSVNEPLFRVGDVSNLVLDSEVDQADVGQLRVGAKVVATFYAFSGRALEGRVVEIFPDADRTTRNFRVRVRLLDPPPALRSGMTAELNIIVEERPNALLAPVEAIDALSAVWVASDGRARKRNVKVGLRSVARAEIVAGLREGERVVTSGAEALVEGLRIRETARPPNAGDLKNAPATSGAR
jgi:HlyD family secretion protein